MMDLSQGSVKQWREITRNAEEACLKYMRSAPLRKLEVVPVMEDRKKFVRLRAKATALLLDAISKMLADELVSSRKIHPT